jgi:hypothetical protein
MHCTVTTCSRIPQRVEHIGEGSPKAAVEVQIHDVPHIVEHGETEHVDGLEANQLLTSPLAVVGAKAYTDCTYKQTKTTPNDDSRIQHQKLWTLQRIYTLTATDSKLAYKTLSNPAHMLTSK